MVIQRQVRIGHAHLRHFRTLSIQLDRGCLLHLAGRPFDHATDNPGGVQLFVATQTFDYVSNSLDRVLGQQLKHTDVLTHTRPRAVTSLQALSKLPKHRRQLPLTVNVRMIQRRRTASKSR